VPHFIVISDLADCTLFFCLSHKGHYFVKKKKLLNTICVFDLLCNFDTFLILRIIQRDIIINVHRSSCRVPVILLYLRFPDEFFKNPQIFNFIKIHPVGADFFFMRTDGYRHTDRQTDRNTEANSRFSQFREHVEELLEPYFCVIYD